MIWKKLKRGLALGAAGNAGFSDTYNHIVDILENIRGEDGVEIRRQGTDWVIRLTGGAAAPDDGGGDGSGDGNGSGSGGTDTPSAPAGIRHVWEDPTIAFGLERIDGGFKMRGGIIHRLTSFYVAGTTITSEGFLFMDIKVRAPVRDMPVEVSYHISPNSEERYDIQGSGWGNALVGTSHICLYSFQADDAGGLRVAEDYVHGLGGVFEIDIDKIFKWRSATLLKSVAVEGRDLKQRSYSEIDLPARPGDETLSETTGTILTAEDYTDGGVS